MWETLRNRNGGFDNKLHVVHFLHEMIFPTELSINQSRGRVRAVANEFFLNVEGWQRKVADEH